MNGRREGALARVRVTTRWPLPLTGVPSAPDCTVVSARPETWHPSRGVDRGTVAHEPDSEVDAGRPRANARESVAAPTKRFMDEFAIPLADSSLAGLGGRPALSLSMECAMQIWWKRVAVVSLLAAGAAFAQTPGTADAKSGTSSSEKTGGAAGDKGASSAGAASTTGSSGPTGVASSGTDAVGSAGKGDGSSGGSSGSKAKKRHHKGSSRADGSGSGTPGTSRSTSSESGGSGR
jgi:hypothetical protein